MDWLVAMILAELHLGEQKVNGELKLRTSGIASHMHKTEIWTPVLISGKYNTT